MTKLDDAIITKKRIDRDIEHYILENNYDLAKRLFYDTEKAATLISTVCSILVDVRDELEARVKDSVWLESEYTQEHPEDMCDEDGVFATSSTLNDIGINIYSIVDKREEDKSPILLMKKIEGLIIEIEKIQKAAEVA